MRIASKRQVTIPMRIRGKMGLLPNAEVEFLVEGKKVILQKAREKNNRGREMCKLIPLCGNGLHPSWAAAYTPFSLAFYSTSFKVKGSQCSILA
ncbi:MAG: AbrB/MazE/SpoVT family DNA-binding domain-containing protein [Deltaproteobacteria bacterium]|nr:AbrB/MazE/SpoVT family DNA-binding domain-containing protein [Deltaproteobacteria bacterium]